MQQLTEAPDSVEAMRNYEETESEIDIRQAYREQAGIIAEAVSEALEDKEFKVEERTFARLVSEVK